ncbi:hypothetical protein KW801_00370 [Candidatus Saccharibacteria bacterium]|nr:hypothetical protein [Candidatus Saccharibacteria bacterium]
MNSGNSIEKLDEQPRTVEKLALELSQLDPRPVANFTPDNLDQVMEDFLSGKIHNPDTATYSKLERIDFDNTASKYKELLEEIYHHPDIPTKHHHVYKKYIERCLDINELMRQAQLYRTAVNDMDRRTAEDNFSELNKKLYSEPNLETAQLMIQEILADVSEVEEEDIVQIKNEFTELLPSDLFSSDDNAQALLPSIEAKQTVNKIVQAVYRPLLRHTNELINLVATEEKVDESELKLGPQAIAVIFQTIIDREFPDSGWKTKIDQANAIYVDPATKTVMVPEGRTPASPDKVRGLVVHELGVHMLRSIIGEKSNLLPLRFGLSGAGEAEEGIAKVMESDVTDDDSRTGYQHYLTATLLGKGHDFRSAFEIMWRYKVLDEYLNKPKSNIDDKFISRQKRNTCKFMFRSIRGTNRLPWHVTLNYFNGKNKIWNYIEKHTNDPDFIIIMFMGKIDPTDEDHLHGALDAEGVE